MKAAVVRSYTNLPQYQELPDPDPGPGEVLINVTAAALSPLVKGQAAGRHYSSKAGFPFVPGVDGVGKLSDGRRVYFAFPNHPHGSMSAKTVVDASLYIPLPDEVDDITAAAAANPGMSSWAALTERAKFVAGESVLINGATGAAGRLAIQICKYLGARRVIVTGRKQDNVNELSAFGADVIIPLDQSQEELTDAFKSVIEQTPVNVILDYLWGHSAESLFQALSGPGRKTGSPRIRYVNIGSVAGNTISFPAAVLRSSGLELLGTGLGSVSNDGLLKSISGVMQAIVPGKFQIEAEPVPLSELTGVWDREQPSKRIVFTL
jgi:NADPH:quinone reductase-like Zn-dependent oxidoreductase